MAVFTFHTVSQYSSLLRAYSYHLWSNQLLAENQSEYPIDILASHEMAGSVSLLFGCSPGKQYSIPYKDYPPIRYELVESVDFKGTGSGLAKWTDTRLYVTANTLAKAEKIMSEYVTDAVEFTRRKDNTRVSVQIYEPKSGGWKYISELPRRPIDTIYLNSSKKEKLISDINTFIADEQEYVSLGIPYKRCYLFQGTPGSGKTSLIFAIASLLKKDISIFNFSAEVNDTIFISAVSQLTSDRILVLEDLDTLFCDRSPVDTHRVSFSALLNVLDGVCRKEKMMTFITTNHMERLDPALLRPGRIDYVMKFGYATKSQIREMYDKFRTSRQDEFEAFYAIVKKEKVNMSLIQQFLFAYRKVDNLMDHEDALEALIADHEEKAVMGVM